MEELEKIEKEEKKTSKRKSRNEHKKNLTDIQFSILKIGKVLLCS